MLLLAVCATLLATVIGVSNRVSPSRVSFFGYKPLMIVSDSMEPYIMTGALVLCKRVDPAEIRERDVVSYQKGNELYTHRVIRILDNGAGGFQFQTKGDNLDDPDPLLVDEEQVAFRVVRIYNGVAYYIESLQPDGKPAPGRIVSRVIAPLLLIVLCILIAVNYLQMWVSAMHIRYQRKRGVSYMTQRWENQSREELLCELERLNLNRVNIQNKTIDEYLNNWYK